MALRLRARAATLLIAMLCGVTGAWAAADVTLVSSTLSTINVAGSDASQTVGGIIIAGVDNQSKFVYNEVPMAHYEWVGSISFTAPSKIEKVVVYCNGAWGNDDSWITTSEGSPYIFTATIASPATTVILNSIDFVLISKLEIYYAPDPNAGLLTGRFSVSATKQVRFSQGNLQAYFASAGTSCTWRFATNQYDYVGSAAANVSINGNGSVSAAGAVDLFGWVGNSSTVLTGTPAKYGISNSTTASDYGTSTSDALKDDWGNLTITANGSATNLGWRTLTSAEWVYLFNTRTSGSTVNGTSNARFTHATINTDGTSVNGVILFPDGVTIANGEATSWGNVNSNSTWSGSTKCTSAQWTALAAKGCVFLPAAGRRRGATVYGLPSSEANVPFGYYWSSSPNASDQAKADHMYFYSDRVYPGNTGFRYDCMSVRLVKDYIFTGLGTQASPYLIASTTDWNNLVSAVNGGETYSGKYFKMTANVGTVETWMTGTFSGTFDGDGKTLTVGYSSSASGCAPFGNLRAATIKNLIVDGTISTSGDRAGGIAYWVLEGNMTYITNCRVSATINSTFSGGASTGGFVGSVQDYGTDGKLTITGCAFTGSLLGSSTNTCGGFVGWNGGTLTIENSLFAPASVTWGTSNSATFTRGGTVTNCYYTQKFNTAQGLQARTIAKGNGVSTLSVTKGSGTTYNVAGITVYSNGVDFNDGSTTTFYGGSSQSVSLALTAATRSGYQFKQYAASQGTLSDETTNMPTLTMPAANSTANDAVTISAEYDPTYNATFADGNDNTDWEIDSTQQIEGGTVTVSYKGENKVKSVTVKANPSTLAGLKAAINDASDLTDLNTKVLGKYVTATGDIQSTSEGAVGIIAYISKTAVDNSFADSRIFVIATENASNSAAQAPSNAAETTYNSTSDLNGYAVTNAWQAAGYAASTAGWNYSASRPDGASHWFVPSYGQWMLGGWTDSNNRPCRLMRSMMEGSGLLYAVSTAINTEGNNTGYCVDGNWWGMGTIQRIDAVRVRAAFVY